MRDVTCMYACLYVVCMKKVVIRFVTYRAFALDFAAKGPFYKFL